MKLRTHVNLIVGCLSAVCVVSLLGIELGRTRLAIHEEIAAANTVATRLLSQVVQNGSGSERDALEFLGRLGRVRANEIVLTSADGNVLYRSPAATYKTGRQAPAWFARWLTPTTQPHVVALADGGRLIIEANPSRAILDGWDDGVRLLVLGGLLFVAINALVFWLVSRALAPLPIIASGLQRIERGELDFRLPELTGDEAHTIGAAFNRMALAMQQKWEAERKMQAAETRLRERQELDELIEQRLNEERQAIARELHDEFAQSVTAIRSLAAVIAKHSSEQPGAIEAARLISTEASRLYDAMHDLIPRLAPLALDTLSLAEALEGLVDEWRRRHGDVQFKLRHELLTTLNASIALAIYRIVQEGLTNAIRHAQPRSITIEAHADDQTVDVMVRDDGTGLATDWADRGRFGLRGLRERVAKLDGELHVGAAETGGTQLRARIPVRSEA